MTNDKGIFIKNIFHMLAYVFVELRRNNFEDLATETFDNIYDLFAEIIARCVSFQLKQGLHKEYIVQQDVMTTLRGRILINETAREFAGQRRRLACEFNELSENNLFNSILKSTLYLLVKHESVANERRKKLKKLLLFFQNVNEVDLNQVHWNTMRFDRNSKKYQMLLFLCYFVCEQLLLTTEKGETKMPVFSDDRMCKLYEKFILEYYRRHHPSLNASAKQVSWNINESLSSASNCLPKMQSDIFLTDGTKTLIIDAKYYSKTMTRHYNKQTIHSHNLYQIFTYVANQDKAHSGNVNGLLLYAKTNEDVVPDGHVTFSDNNVIYFKTLDLNVEFSDICKQLDAIVCDNFNVVN